MNGVDHLEPQADLLPILEEVQKKLPEDEAIMQYNMDDYVKAVDKFVKENDIKLPVHENELRSGHDWEILKGTLSPVTTSRLPMLRPKRSLKMFSSPFIPCSKRTA